MLKTAQTGDFRPGQLNDDGTGTGVHRWALQEVINMHKTADDARMGTTWRLQHGKVYLDRARFFVERCASAKGQPELQHVPPFAWQQAAWQLQSRLAAMKRVAGTNVDGTCKRRHKLSCPFSFSDDSCLTTSDKTVGPFMGPLQHVGWR